MPQRIQVSLSMTCGWRLSPLIASTGQLRAHTVQPVQVACINFVVDQRPANPGRAAFFVDMGFVFIPEIFQGADAPGWERLARDRIGCSSALRGIKLSKFSISPASLCLHRCALIIPGCGAYPTRHGSTFAAAFFLGEFHKKAGNIHHAGVIIHDNQPARAHHRAGRNE